MYVLPFDKIATLPLTASITLRVSRIEREYLDGQAADLGVSLSEYCRMKLADERARQKLAMLITRKNERAEYATLLIALGKSRIANNLNQLAYHAHLGALEFTPDVIAQITEAYEAIKHIRALLIEGAGGRAC